MHISPIVKSRAVGIFLHPVTNEPYAHQIRECDSRNYHRVIVEISNYMRILCEV